MAIVSFYYTKLKSYYRGYSDQQKPVLTAGSAVGLSILFVLLYVIPFYLFKRTRPTPTLNRDAPSVIKARIQMVTVTVIISLASTFYLLHMKGQHTVPTALHFLGLYPIDPLSIIESVLLTVTLFAGPLYERIFLEKALTPWSSLPRRMKDGLSSSQGYRNYIAGPLTEELLFRSSIIALHLMAHVSATKITFFTPLYFGIAHINHFYEFSLTHPHTPTSHALFRSLFHCTYTTIFGWYASFIFLRTGNLYAAFIIHAFCNYMGLPRFWGRVELKNDPATSPVLSRGKDDMESSPRAGQAPFVPELPMRCTIIYYVLLCAGAYGFYKGLFPMTEGEVALASFNIDRT